MQFKSPYRPERTITGPAYSPLFKAIATAMVVMIAAYTIGIALRFPLPLLGYGAATLLVGAALMLGISYYWFMRSTVTIDDKGITQTWMYKREVAWADIHGARMIGIPYMSAIIPPRLLVRAGNSYKTFHGGTQALLVEFAKISLAYQGKK